MEEEGSRKRGRPKGVHTKHRPEISPKVFQSRSRSSQDQGGQATTLERSIYLPSATPPSPSASGSAAPSACPAPGPTPPSKRKKIYLLDRPAHVDRFSNQKFPKNCWQDSSLF